MEIPLEHRTFVITGATSGIGLAVARALLQNHASVVGIGRNPGRCQQALHDVERETASGSKVKYLVADLALQSEVRGLSARIAETLDSWGYSRLDGLVNNAATVPFWQTLTPEGVDVQWAVNHLASFLLTLELLPLLRSAPAGRVVIVSSGSHYGARLDWQDVQLLRHYTPLRAYCQTKLANVLFAAEFNRRYAAETRVRAFAADPGLVNTEIGLKSNSAVARWIWDLRRRAGVAPEKAAQGIVYLVTEPSIQDAQEVYWKHSRPKAPSSFASNPQAAKHLWELSAQMCGLTS